MHSFSPSRWLVKGCVLLFLVQSAMAQTKRLVIFDQDAGPARLDLALLLLLQTPQVEILGATMVTGDAWRDEETAHTLRLLELVGRSGIPVVPGAVFPLVRTQQWTHLWEQLHGKVEYQGAWTESHHGPFVVPSPLPEGDPTIQASSEDAAHFMVRMVHLHPHQVTIYGAGPLTNLALAIRLDPDFAATAKELVVMGGSIPSPRAMGDFPVSLRYEFNFWFDPEATHIVGGDRNFGPRGCKDDVAEGTHLTQAMLDRIAASRSPLAQYISRYQRPDNFPLWDELTAAAWLDPSLITEERVLYMDVSLDRGSGYGETEAWLAETKPQTDVRPVNVQIRVDAGRFEDFVVQRLAAPSPPADPH